MIHSIKNNIFLLKFIAESSKFRIPLAIIVSLINAVPPILNVLTIKHAMDMAVSGDIFKAVSFVLSAACIYIIIIAFGGWYRNNFCLHSNVKIEAYIQTVLYKKVSEIDLLSYDDADFYDMFTKALNETSSRSISVLNSLTSFITSLTTIAGITTIIVTLEPIIIVFSLVPVLISLIVSTLSNKCRYDFEMDVVPVNRKKGYIRRLFYMKQYIKDMRLFDLYSYFVKQYNKENEKHNSIINKYENKFLMFEILQTSAQVLSVFGTILFLAFQVNLTVVSVGDFAGLLNSSQELGSNIGGLFSIVPELQKNSMHIDNLKSLLSYNSKTECCDDKSTCVDDFKCLTLNNVSFRYNSGGEYILKNINLKISKGQKIAIVGYNGSGKSTLIKCILKLYDPSSGKIFYNEAEYTQLNPKILRTKFGVVFQDFQNFAVTVADNILCKEYNSEKDNSVINSALLESGLMEKVLSLPNGILSMITKEFDDKGVVLSGGENQKLAIARALAKKCDILVFDEPSSSLDPLAEYELNQKIMKIADDKTLIIVSHRLYTTKDVDKILFLEDGRVVEEGTHDELMKLSGKYAKLYNIQNGNA